MRTMPLSAFARRVKFFVATIFLSTLAFNAHAVLINFDDLVYVPVDPDNPHFSDVPLDNQYLSQGLGIANAYLLPYLEADSDPDVISGPNYLLAGASGSPMTLYFVGELPTYVGMYVGSFINEMIFVDAYGPAGLVDSLYTKGEGGPFNDQSPYEPRQYLSFESATGISSIDVTGWYGSRVSGYIDDITFTYAAVPEPSQLILLAIGALAFFSRRVSAKYYA